MLHLDHIAFNACRDERGVGHHTLRALAMLGTPADGHPALR